MYNETNTYQYQRDVDINVRRDEAPKGQLDCRNYSPFSGRVDELRVARLARIHRGSGSVRTAFPKTKTYIGLSEV